MSDIKNMPNHEEMDRIREEALEFAGIGLYRYRFDGTIIFMDRGAFNVFELNGHLEGPDKAAGRNIEELIDYIQPKGFLRDRIRKAGRLHNFEHTFRTLSGNVKWLLHDTYLVENPFTGEQEIQAVIRDISDRKREREELRESEEKYRHLIETLPHCVAIFQDGRVVFANTRTLEMFGFESMEQLIGQDTLAPLPEWERERAADYTSRRARGFQTPDQYTMDFLRRDGSVFTGDVFLKNIFYLGRPALQIIVSDITDRMQAETALAKSEREKGLIMDSISELLVYHGPDLRVIWANRAAAESVDARGHELAGRYCYEVWHGRDKICEGCPIIEVVNTRRASAGEITSPDGRVWYLRGYPVLGPDGALEGVVEVGLDITARKKAERALKESEARMSAAIESLPFDFFMIGKDGTYTMVNSACHKNWGFFGKANGRGLVGLRPEDLGVSQETLAVWLDNNRRAFGGETVTGEESFRLPEGTRHLFNIIAPVKMDGEIREILGVNIDITDRKRAEEALAAEKERLAVTLCSIGDGVISADTKGRVLMMNQVAEKLTGWTQEEAFGKPLSEVFCIFDASTRDRCQDPVQRILGNGETVALNRDTVLAGREGVEKNIADSGAPIRDRDGAVVGVVLVFRDITEKQRMERELQKSEKIESLGILAGGIAHDFNNILTAILGNISMAEQITGDNPRAHKRLKEAEKACFRAKDLTQQLLTFTKGGAPVKITASLRDLLEESAQFSLRGSNVKSELKIDPGLWPVEMDPGQIAQVANNLVINADQAMPEGGVLVIAADNVTVDEENILSLPAGPYARFSVIDQGVGIPEEYQNKIFDPFFTTKQKGSGLGLTTSYSIIKRHGGRISITSSPGRGSRFDVYLPARPDSVIPPPKAARVPDPGQGRVLVMDDEPAIRELLSFMLEDLGYTADFASSGEEAVKKYAQALTQGNPFDLCILDLTVPGGMGGKEAMTHLLDIDPQAKAVVSSGYSTDPVMADYRAHGFSGVVSKPYDMQELSQVLRGILKP